jgi:hypothetical protein
MKRTLQQIFRCFITVILGCATQVVVAQQELMNCGTDAADIKGNAHMRITQNDCAMQPSTTGTDTIPTVVHVIHMGEPVGTGSNISDVQIREAISRMNDDFKNKSGKGKNVRMYFVLARSGPNGESTTGITRTDGRVLAAYAQYGASFSTLPGAKIDSVKNLNIWPNTDYSNIWCVNKIAGSFSGSALCDPLSPTEGVVISSSYFKKTESTLTHEVGHYWNLRHVFQGETANSCPVNDDCQTQGDGNCDTPPIKHTDLNGSGCPNTSGYPITNSTNNHMSYNFSDSCYLFTAGQVEIMRTMLLNRLSLLASSGLVSSMTPLEISVESIVNAATESVCDSAVIKISVENKGSVTISNASFRIYINDVDKGIVTASNLGLLPKTTNVISLPRVPIDMGTQSVKCVALTTNGQSDFLKGNNISCTDITFEPAWFMITTEDPANGRIYGGGGHQCGNLVTLDAYPDPGFIFKRYFKNGIAQSWASGHSFVASETFTVSAEFTAITTGIDNSIANNGFEIFPNPANNVLNIRFGKLPTDKTTIEVLDIIGQTVYTDSVRDQDMAIDVSNLSKGNYILKLQSGTDIVTERFIKH